MGFTISDTTYAGKNLEGFITRAMIGNEPFQKGIMYIEENVDKKFTIPRLVLTDLVQAVAATPVSQGTATVDGRTLTPGGYMLYWEFNPKKFDDHWFSAMLEGSLLDRTLPATLESAIVQEFLKYHDDWLASALFSSDNSGTDLLGGTDYVYFDGWVRKMLDDSDVNDVSSPVTLTSANIEAKFQACEDLLITSAPALLYDPDTKFIVSYKTAKLWERAQASATYKGIDNTRAGLLAFQGREIVPIKGCPDNTIILTRTGAARTSNLWAGVQAISDSMEIKLMPLQNNSDKWFIKMINEIDVNHGFGADVVLYTTLT